MLQSTEKEGGVEEDRIKKRATYNKEAVCNIPTTFLTIDNSFSSTFIHKLKAAIKADLTSLPGAEDK